MATHKFDLYRLHFTTPLHISNSRADYGVSLRSVLSDTMYAALTATLAKMGETIPEDGNLGCVISGLFPYCKTSDKVDYYFPKPLSTRLSRNLDNDTRKAMKKQTWLKQSLFEQVLQGQELSEKQEAPEIMQTEESARVKVSRTGENAEPFYMERLYFTENTGLYFLVKGKTDLVDKALPLLALEGIGTDRNVGNGAFVYEKDSITINEPDNTEYAVSLSTFIPDSKEQLCKALGAHAAYELIRRGGWITDAEGQGLRKNAVYALAAGSVLAGIKTGDGAIVNLAPKDVYTQHPVWRCGKTFCLPIKL